LTVEQINNRSEHSVATDPAARQPDAVRDRHRRSARVWAGLRRERRPSAHAVALISVSVGVIFLGAVAVSDQVKRVSAACATAPAPGSNWDFCDHAAWSFVGRDLAGFSARNASLPSARFARANLVDADFSYAELRGADFSLSRLNRARFIGTNLRGVMFNHAQLGHADLRYADLTDARLMGAEIAQARFDHALWIDGRRCGVGSVGRCSSK
jgi:hypothetical protein